VPRRSIPDLVNTFHLSVFLFFLLQFVNCKQQLIDGNLFVLRIFRKFSDQFFVRSSSVFQRFPRPLPPDAADIPQAEDKEQNQNEKDKRHRQKNRICLPDTGKKGCTGRGKNQEAACTVPFQNAAKWEATDEKETVDDAGALEMAGSGVWVMAGVSVGVAVAVGVGVAVGTGSNVTARV